ncbi:MAG: Crp/Fnr family transcriptional regulator [Chloroflexi bacterium]|nr:Crp/Fnr family transcriptional regulator [Chloroflexota bacterium]
MISPEILRRYPFFAGFSHDHLVILANAGEERFVETGTYFFHEGDTVHELYLVLQGAVGIIFEPPDRAVSHKVADQLVGDLSTEEIVVSAIGPGEIFAWSGLVPPHTTSAAVKALAPTRVIAFDCDALLEAFESDCKFGFLMMQKIATVVRGRLRDLRIESLAYMQEKTDSETKATA